MAATYAPKPAFHHTQGAKCLNKLEFQMNALYHQSLKGDWRFCVCSILLILLHRAGLSPLKTLETHWFSADYKYAWKSIHIWQWGERKIEKNTGRAQRPWNVHLHLLQSFILFPSLPSAAHVHIFTAHTHRQKHIYACAAGERERETEKEYVEISKLSIPFSPTVPVGLCTV